MLNEAVQQPQQSLIRRIFIDYLGALIVVILTICTGIVAATCLNIEIRLYPIPFWALWWLFLLELFNLGRIFYEERENRAGTPLIKIKTAVFLFYPFLSGCWILSPWVIFQHNKIAANLAISAYGHYWGKHYDIDRAFDSAMILYYCTREPTFLHAIPDGIIHGSEETFLKAKRWFLRVLSKEMKLHRIRLPRVQHFMISPLRQTLAQAEDGKLATKSTIGAIPEVARADFPSRLVKSTIVQIRIRAVFSDLIASQTTNKLLEYIPRRGFYRKICESLR